MTSERTLRDLKWAGFGLGALLAVACSASKPPPASNNPVLVAGTNAPLPPTAAPAAGLGAVATAGRGAASPGAPAAVGGGGAVSAGDLPCPVAHFLELHCLECHGTQPRLGAPVSLINAASFSKMSMNGLPLHMVVLDRIQNAMRPMPPQMLLSAAEVAPVVPWLKAGAPVDPNGCAAHDPTTETGAAGSDGTLIPAGGAGAPPTVGSGGAPAVGTPPDEGALGADWPMFGGDLGDTRANMKETKLTVQNVSGLKELWTFKAAGNTATPAIYKGTLYLPMWSGKVYALDAKTGMQKWMATLPDLIDSSPAVTETQVFVGDDQGSLHAIDRATGKVQWSQLVDKHPEAHLWSSPIYVPDVDAVLVGVASGEEAMAPPYAFTFRGSVVAVDAKTGAEKWRFYTTSGDATSGPGVGVWATVAVDTTRKLAFVGTGNAYSGVSGKYVDSMLALKYDTGMLAWSKQFTADDVFNVLGGSLGPDFDIGGSANLFSAGGKDLIGIGIKSGDYVTLERDSGNMVWVRHVSSGSAQGGVIGTPAYANGKIFVPGNTYPIPQTVTLAALDAVSGNVAWMTNISGALVYGGLLYANGIVFVGLTNRVIAAYDASSGKQIWSAMAPDAIAGGPSLADGVLYVPWGYVWCLREGNAGAGGLTAYGLK